MISSFKFPMFPLWFLCAFNISFVLWSVVSIRSLKDFSTDELFFKKGNGEEGGKGKIN